MDSSTLLSPPVADSMWFFEIIIGVVALIAVNFLFRRLVKYVRRRSISSADHWGEKVDHIFFLPFQILLWILGLTLVVEILGRRFDFSFFESYIEAFRSTGLVFCLAWIIMRWKGEALRAFLHTGIAQKKVDSGFVQVIGRILSVMIVIIATMIVLQIWGLDIAPLIAFGGVGAAAVGFAAKDVLANFFGGMMLHINRPFMTGDYVIVNKEGVEGYVEEIGWNITTIRDKDKRPIYLPNALFSNVLVINSSRMTHRRIELKIPLRYEDFSKIPSLTDSIKKAISLHPDIDTHLPVLVLFNAFNEYSLDLIVDVYTLKTRYDHYLQSRHEILLLIYNEVKQASAEMPFPTMQLLGLNSAFVP